jgi:hypothetical protein
VLLLLRSDWQIVAAVTYVLDAAPAAAYTTVWGQCIRLVIIVSLAFWIYSMIFQQNAGTVAPTPSPRYMCTRP